MGVPEPFTKVRNSRVGFASVGATAVAAVSSDESRVAMWLSGNAGATITWGTLATLAAGQGLNIPAQAGPIPLTYETAGECIRSTWYAIASAAGPFNVGFIEVTSN